MALPPVAPFPPAGFRKDLAPEDWEACLDAWLSLTEAYLHLPDDAFQSAVAHELSGFQGFMISFYAEISSLTDQDSRLSSTKVSSLRRVCFLLCHRVLTEHVPPHGLLGYVFLSNFCRTYPKSSALQKTLSALWRKNGHGVELGLQKLLSQLTRSLDNSKTVDGAADLLKQLLPLLHASPDVGEYFMTGSDFLDSLCSGYTKASDQHKKTLVITTYLGLLSLIRVEKHKYALLSDHLYALKADAEARGDTVESLLSDLVTNTPILSKIRDATSPSEGARARNIAVSLDAFASKSLARPKKHIRRKVTTSKGKAPLEETVHGDVHVHQMSMITQVQDLFPDLGSAFIVKLLDEYNNNVEQVTAHLLDDSLPPHLQHIDRSEQLPQPSEVPLDHADLEPRSTPPLHPSTLPQRRNIFDNDDFDRLAVDASQLRIGGKQKAYTANDDLADGSTNKAAILSALAAFDADDDERDDTYDVEDVGATVDTHNPEDADPASQIDEKHEEMLFKAWSTRPEDFGRETAVRKGSARARMKMETGMTDEAIEGWAIMMRRNPRNLRRLQTKYTDFSGQQADIRSTRWRAEEEEGEEGTGGSGTSTPRGGQQGRGRGRGGRGRGRGSSVAGDASEKGTQQARHRKEASKGSRANHNRRDQRARKMARGGGGVLPG